jgi:NAD(P)-dependent dehydrogenase (short-subunit alcohol dehydrogenase family)
MGKKHALKQQSTAIITGASTGIGRAVAVQLAKQFSGRVVLNARQEGLLNETAEMVRQAGGQAVTVPGDVSDKELHRKLVDTCLTEFGSVDLLVNNAGLARPGSVSKLTPEDWEFVFKVNFFGALYAIYEVLPHFSKQGQGKIVNVASVAGKVSFPGSVCYAASKFAMTGMSEGMAAELSQQNIDVITVCPGWVRTEFFSNNKVMDGRNPTLIAEGKDLRGWLMRNVLSVSSEETADEIIKACQKGGAHEVVLTGPGIFIERMHALFPGLVQNLSARVPSEY